ncbi:hypothetical protein GP486_006890 [Trichoglossum hirsutum]|uniref:Polycystin cation channel PKD1/PKD2 domain-containing protein n=1 Tax=Trichoglossum hirsutum TaxID=265104 RepID=A0A9P8L590_9PEZI|nr:hypothetical protein GP486_006890 [Trichoglossum hirsutum]
MVHWRRFFTWDSHRGGDSGRIHLGDEIGQLLPQHTTAHQFPSTFPAVEVTKVAQRLKFLIETTIPVELEEARVTRPHSAVVTRKVVQLAKEAGGEEYKACVVFALLVCKKWVCGDHFLLSLDDFQGWLRLILELWDAGLHDVQATACEVIAKALIESEQDQDYLFQEVLLKRYSIIYGGEVSTPSNAVERAADLHALRVISSSGYQKCISYLWRGWLIQSEEDPTVFIPYKNKADTNYWTHFNPNRMRAPIYQNWLQMSMSILFLALYTEAINTINPRGDLDVVEGLLYIFTLGFICDELSKIWKVGRYYIGFWNAFNVTLYSLLTVSFVMRVIALGHPPDDGKRNKFNQLGYNFLAFSAPMFWVRLLLYLDTFRFFGAMLVVLKVMMKESLIFFALLAVVAVGFLQGFIGMDNLDKTKDATRFILQAMANSVMQSPDFSGFENFAPPFGIVLYYLFTFVIMVLLLNILIALYNSAYTDITDNSTDEYMALFTQKTLQFVRAPDENVFIAPFNLIEIFFLVLPFEWWLPSDQYEHLNVIVMATIYSPLLLITAFLETRAAHRVVHNRGCGEADDDTHEEWEVFEPEDRESDFASCSWRERVEGVRPNIEDDLAVVEVRALKEEVRTLKEAIRGLTTRKERGEVKGES